MSSRFDLNHVHLCGARDMDAVMDCEALTEAPDGRRWSSVKINMIRTANGKSLGIVVRVPETGRVVGYALYRHHRHHIELVRLIVHPAFREQGAGRAMIAYIKMKLRGRRNAIVAHVRDSHDDAHRFLARCDFAAFQVVRGLYGDDDGYSFAHVRDDVCSVVD